MKSRKRNLMSAGSALAFAFALALLPASGLAQADAKKEKALELKLSANVTTLCVGTAIDLELELKNAGERPVGIDTVDIWASFVYSYQEPGGAGTAAGTVTGCGHCRGNTITLFAGETHWAAHKFSLAGDFFGRPGEYKISTSVESTSSNRLKFELIDCGKS